MDSTRFFSKLILRIIILLGVTALLIFISISCKKDSEITTNTDTTLILKEKKTKITTIDFLIYVIIYNGTSGAYEPTDANLTVSVNNNIVLDTLLEAKTNDITINDNSLEYVIKITKQNYISYTDMFTRAELITKFSDPLIITLKPVMAKSLIAYYP